MQKLGILTILLCIFLRLNTTTILADEVTQTKGSIILQELLFAHQTIAHKKPSHSVDRQIPGSIVLIREKKYEIVSFIFEDPNDNLSDVTFDEYARKNNLLAMRTSIINPIKNIEFEVFDSNNAHLSDEVYFYISLRVLPSS